MEQTDLFEIRRMVHNALEEDIRSGDITTDSIIPYSATASAELIAKEEGIICGLEVAAMVFMTLDNKTEWHPVVNEGDFVSKGARIALVNGQFRALLSGERTALNFLQRMSGIATKTTQFCNELQGYKTKLLDTRKTAPGLRHIDKYAVKTGGGTNHRYGLYDMVLIKDNHITLAGGITPAIEAVKERHGSLYRIEVECASIQQVTEALKAEADVIMLDNMPLPMMKQAVELIGNRAKTEASGNITLERLRPIAETGVDYISSGALTHTVKALDISMLIK
ncbi:MAG: carboxylating nicotinate-nucleotide diphosphorylase [Bacteroidales bacterium]|jgi:nicotinate-nucleotide pyrophosphorylase (carboxylating)|nr:carboxylating nicotinate-nucleotide diphosphorylase [Bacteroidales bacterium]MDD3960850.1 carboxylating nicotinate-nucleotide diphosphorylase [Bacteroidales bacterium]MDY0284667.1 carboxylating nicotinate-nucleotide diphosphorylase [Bacteroidales bacterium]HPE86988.1 carboxylating nicotinate-nucleotide diphosphorylase [Bacteroidales bacterium]